MPIGDPNPVLPLLHLSVDHPIFPRPAESHVVFGAGFLFLGALMSAEGIAGGVWYHSRARTLFFPVVLVLLGLGMLAVTIVEPENRLAHFAMGVPMTVGGWAEARVRIGEMERRYADLFIVAALVFAALETALFHLSGPPTSGIFLTHASIAITAVGIGGLRIYQSQAPASLFRSLLIAAAVASVGVQLFIDGFYQSGV